MQKIRLVIFLLTLTSVLSLATVLMFYAKGYRLNSKDLSINPHGLLVVKSHPDGAQIFVNGELNTATNATLSLKPGDYDITIKKEGFMQWSKKLNIQKEIVTEAQAQLFKSAPSLSAITFLGAGSPTPSRDFTKIAYTVASDKTTSGYEGLWVTETVSLPLGFAREPRRITDGDLSDSSYVWSPDGRQIMLTTPKGSYLLDVSVFTPQSKRINIAFNKDEIFAKWEDDEKNLVNAQIKKLPQEMQNVLVNKSSAVMFSPNEEMVLYVASDEAKINSKLTDSLPGASTQKENRDIKPYSTYVYDIKEDRNFLIDENSKDLQIKGGYSNGFSRRLTWYVSSKNLILAETNKISIVDYDGTNKQSVYTGAYVAPNAFPTLSLDRILILTNFGADENLANLYSVTIK